MDPYLDTNADLNDSPSLRDPLEDGGRERWSSRLTFILGAIGSAVGLGNLWRFPALVYANGGAAFLLPYGAAFFMFGVPLLFLELLMGRHFQGGDPVCFGGIDSRLKGIGWASVLNSFVITTYYNVIIAYTCIMFVNSFSSPFPWSNEESPGTWFFGEQLKNVAWADTKEISIPVLLGTLFVWLCVFLSIYKGVKVVSKVVMISVPLPIILLIVLLISNLGQDGSGEGVTAYLGSFDGSKLGDTAVWQAAVGQIFFSIGVCFGVMTAYSSYRDPNEGVLVDTFLISGFNSLISILAGFVVYTSLGILAKSVGQSILDPDNTVAASGLGLVFVAYPQALDLSPAPVPFSIIFFGVIFFLALDSAFSLVEAVTTAVNDSDFGRHISREYVTVYVCVVCCACSVFFCLDNGLTSLDTVDFYVNNFGMLMLGMLECVAAAWMYKRHEAFAVVGETSTNWFAIGYWLPVTASVFLLTFAGPFGYAGLAAAPIAFIPLFWYIAFTKRSNDEISFGEWFHELNSVGVRTFTKMMMDVEFDGETGSCKYTFAYYFCGFWGFCVKYFIPTVLYFLIVSGVRSSILVPYEGYSGAVQNVGRFVVFLGVLIMVGFWIVEDAYLKAGMVNTPGNYIADKSSSSDSDMDAKNPMYEKHEQDV